MDDRPWPLRRQTAPPKIAAQLGPNGLAKAKGAQRDGGGIDEVRPFLKRPQIMQMPFNPLDALSDDKLFSLFERMLSNRYRSDILSEYYRLEGIASRFNWWGTKVTPSDKAHKELTFLRERNRALGPDGLDDVVEEFWQKLSPNGDHLRDHLATEAKYNEIALRATDLKLIEPLFYLFPDHETLDIVDIGAGRNLLGVAIKKQFDLVHGDVSYFNWLDNLGGAVSHPKRVQILGTDVSDWHSGTDAVEGVEYRLQPTPTTIDIADESRNVVITKWSFHHMTMSQMDRQVRNIFRILRPGGVAIVIEAFASRRKSLPPEFDDATEPTFEHRVLEVSRRFNAKNIWPDGPWKDDCVKITRDYLRLHFDQQRQVLALEDFVGHYVLNRRTSMPFPFSYLAAEDLIAKFRSAGFIERRADFELFGQAPIIRRGPPTARFMFEKPQPW